MIAKTWKVSFETRKKGQRVITTRKKPLLYRKVAYLGSPG